MKILLTTPPQPEYSILPNRYKPINRLLRLIGGNKPILGIQPPYGLLYISSYLKRDGYAVFVIDGLSSSTEQILKSVKENGVELVGISSVSWNWQEAKKLACALRRAEPSIKLAVGGAHVNAEKGAVLEDCACIDYAFYGDGEESFLSVAKALSSGKKPALADGFAYREGDKIISSGKSAFINDIDRILLPDRDAVGIDKYCPSPLSYRRLPFTAMFGSRGCPYQCTFCHTDKHVRMRSAESLVEEIEILQKKYGIKEILFYDDTFTLDKKRVFEFCDLLQKRKIDLSWSASVRTNTIDAKILDAMKNAGCWRLLIGIESGSQRLLDLIKKRQTLHDIEYAVNLIHDAGIHTFGMFMFGIPTETYEEGLQTIEFMKKLKLDYVSVCNLTPFPGTEIYKEVADEPGFKGLNSMNMFDISYVPRTMSEDQLKDILRRSMREFYLRPSYVLRQFRNIKSFTDVVRYIKGVVIIGLR